MRKITKLMTLCIICFKKYMCLYRYRKVNGRVHHSADQECRVSQGAWGPGRAGSEAGLELAWLGCKEVGVEGVAGRCGGMDGSAENKFRWDFRDNLLFSFAYVLESANLS